MDIRDFTKAYTEKSDFKGAISLIGSLTAYGVFLALATALVQRPLVSGMFILLLAFASVRLYVLQHDCGHGSLFRTRALNDPAGHLLSLFSLTPYRVMQHNHNLHHAYLGNLDHRETTEVHTMTLAEWRRASWGRRFWYRLYRNPLLMLPLGGIYAYCIAHRWPRNTADVGAGAVIAHNLALLAYLSLIWVLAGAAGLAVLGLSAVIAGAIGVFLVYLQHNFEHTYWDRKPALDFRRATLEGSSSLDLGWWWDLGTANIAYHDLHHFNPAIPSYNLRRCQRDLPDDLKRHDPIRWPEALASFRLKLWDEAQEKLVPFPQENQHLSIAVE